MHKELLLAAAVLYSTSAMAWTPPVAGSQPDRRPANAPMIHGYPKPTAWYAHALHGVLAPFPPTLGFLEFQGAWYTPFNRPGMTGPYDLRHWH